MVRTERFRPHALSLLRFVTGFLFMFHGAQKLFGWFAESPGGPLNAMMMTAGVLEFFGGFLIMIGLLTRPVAFLLAGEMAVAYFMAHQPQGGWPIQNRGELAALYCFIYLYLSTAGAGPYSVDAMLARRRGVDVGMAEPRRA
ncbi:MAG TPA: DoxX family protein [Gemmatimonadaceae bacterium]|nr:DoxX family protein [Gemmatimonadaceae bacterium]